jgi:hypothetical protein
VSDSSAARLVILRCLVFETRTLNSWCDAIQPAMPLGCHLLRLMWCASCPSVHRSRKQEHGQAHSTQSHRPGHVGGGIARASATVCHPRYLAVPAIGVLLCPAPPCVPRESLLTGGVRVRVGRYGLPPRLCAVRPCSFTQSDKQVWIVARSWTVASPEEGPSAPATVYGSVDRSRRVALGDRRKHDCDRKVQGEGRQGQLRQAIGPSHSVTS